MVKLIYKGNCEDIRCSMQHGFADYDLDEEIREEKATRNRSTVIKLLERAKKAKAQGRTYL